MFKIEKRTTKSCYNKIVENHLQLHAHNGSGFDIWIVLNNLPCDKHIVDIIKNGKGIVKLKVLNGYTEDRKNRCLKIFILDVV